jgi:hypothetical protein
LKATGDMGLAGADTATVPPGLSGAGQISRPDVDPAGFSFFIDMPRPSKVSHLIIRTLDYPESFLYAIRKAARRFRLSRFRRDGRRPLPFQISLESAALLGIFSIAVILRLWDMSARNLWTDEAWVALAALAPTPHEALVLGLSTPPFYILSIWSLAHWFGGSEAVLRSLSFAFGAGTVVIFWLAARRLASTGTALMGSFLVAISPVLVYFSKELKQYSGDAFFAVLLVWLTEAAAGRPILLTWAGLALAGTLALGFSHGAVFILPVLLVVLWFKESPSRRLRVVCLGAFWAASVASFYLFFYRRQVSPMLLGYWAGDFPDFSGLRPFLAWLGGALGRYFHYFFHYFFYPGWGWLWGALFTALGLIFLSRQGPRRLAAYWGGPLIMAFAAAALHRYPFMGHFNGSRLLLFSAPWLYLITATGLTAAFLWLRGRPQRWLAPLLAGLILVTTQPLALTRENLRPLGNRQELKPVAAYLQSHIGPGDLVYVYYHAIYPFKYYYKGDQGEVIWGKDCVETGLALPAAGSAPPRHLWLAAAHFQDMKTIRKFALGLLGPNWREASVFARHNAALLLFVPRDQAPPKSLGALSAPPRCGPATPPGGTACTKNP